ncbi:hypothetical protein PAHAL_9G323700 [Panicum hallii]|uniref:Uncharacterized protein n=1 Tax=Panicum hallii TaxID=206008 RepID=A0A2T8I3A0_9POAL|nr:hypothetical protein PAHAL_9G323700 [Panicum hallii]
MHIRFKRWYDSSSQMPTHVSDSMSVDSIALPGQGATSRRIQVLTEEGQIVLRTDLERQAFTIMRNSSQKPVWTNEFGSVFHNVGWLEFWSIAEPGSKLLTLEFLSTLEVTDTSINFCMFNEEFSSTWRTLSNALGFNKRCSLDSYECFPNFDTNKFGRKFLAKKVVEHYKLMTFITTP